MTLECFALTRALHAAAMDGTIEKEVTTNDWRDGKIARLGLGKTMDAHAVSLLAIFEKKMRLEVPLFQRQYVWSREQQWEPLWEDITRKFVEHLDGRRAAPVHFLGAMVLDQKQTPTTHVERRQVIDGQQRLTTLQIFISAFRDFCREHGCEELAKECDGFTIIAA